MPLVDFNNVTKVFSNGSFALKKLTFSVGSHEFVSIVGPSGCGKTTILKLIAGLIKESSGTVKLSKKLKIGYVFQEPTLMPWAKADENVMLPLILEGVKKSEAKDKAHYFLEKVGLKESIYTYPRELSGGMKMRVSLARALTSQPNLLLMDEPFAALDEMTRFSLNDDLLDLWQQNKWTVIFVTHSIFEAAYLSSKVFVMTKSSHKTTIDIPLPYPRKRSYRMSEKFGNICKSISDNITKEDHNV